LGCRGHRAASGGAPAPREHRFRETVCHDPAWLQARSRWKAAVSAPAGETSRLPLIQSSRYSRSRAPHPTVSSSWRRSPKVLLGRRGGTPAVTAARRRIQKPPRLPPGMPAVRQKQGRAARGLPSSSPKPRLAACTLAANGRVDAELSGEVRRAAGSTQNEQPFRQPGPAPALLLRTGRVQEQQPRPGSCLGDKPGATTTGSEQTRSRCRDLSDPWVTFVLSPAPEAVLASRFLRET
jgi:hypothetical protein